MPKAVKTPSGKWRIRVYMGRNENGNVITHNITADTRREAERLAAAYNINREIIPESPKLLLKEATEQYIETCRATNKSPSTIRGYVGMQKRLDADLGSHSVEALTLHELQSWINKLSTEASPKTVRNYWGLLTSILSFYRPDLHLSAIRLPALREYEVVIPTDAQVTTMLDAALSTHDQNLYKAILLSAFCGLRRSEICALEWDDLNRRQLTLSVTKACVRNEYNSWVTKRVTKTKAGKRTVTVTPDVMKNLYIARNRTDKRVVPVAPDSIYNHYARAASKLSIPTRLHYLRHYHCSVLISLGYPEKYIIERLGWNSVDMIRKVYGHVVGEKRDALDYILSQHTTALLEGKQYAYR